MTNPRPAYWRDAQGTHTTEVYGRSYDRPVYNKPNVIAAHSFDAHPLGLAVLLIAFLAARRKWTKDRKALARKTRRRRQYH